jgi:hypothetical protein
VRKREKRKAAKLLVHAERSSGEQPPKGSQPLWPLTLPKMGCRGCVVARRSPCPRLWGLGASGATMAPMTGRRCAAAAMR